MKNPSTPSVLFRLCDDALIVANTGAPFTREGVIAICHLHLSSKDKDTLLQERVFIKENRRLIADIAGRMIESYRPNSNRIIEDARGEIGLNKEYQGRLLWELLQNVDDAAVAADPGQAARDGLQPIGAKGLGFKSVLEISESPEIYSGDFRFLFSRERTLDRLQGILKGGDNTVPIFRIPHECEPGKDCKDLLQNGRSTVIRLPFHAGKERETHDKLAEKLGSLSETCLLLCQKLERIDIEIQGQYSRVLEIDRDGAFGFHCEKATFTLAKNNHQTQWRRWCKEWTPRNDRPRSVAVFLPLENGKEMQCGEEQRLHVFFPADREKISAKALIHADYELENNREGLQKMQPCGDEIRAEVCKIVERVLKEIDPAVALRAFGSVAANGEDGNETSKLNAAIAETVLGTAFVPVIGGGCVKPAEVRLWQLEIGKVLRPEKVGDRKILAPELEEIRGIISNLIPHHNIRKGALEHAEILQNCKNNSLEECLEAVKIAVKIRRSALPNARQVDESLEKAPFWWTGETGRALTGESRLLQKQPDEWPDFIKCDELDPIFLEKLQTPAGDANKMPAASISESLKKVGNDGKGGLWPLESSNYFEDILLPFCQGEGVRWQDIGGKILSLALKWHGESKWHDNPKIAEDAKQTFRFPTGSVEKKEWLVAADCYAGEAWGGPAHFDSFFKDIPNRGVVLPLKDWGLPPNAENSVGKWKPLLERFSVSRTPKTWKCPQKNLRHIDRKYGLESDAIERFIGERRPYGSDVRFVDHFPKSMGKKPSEILEMAINMKRDGCEFSRFSQFQTCRWLPCTQAILSREGERLARPKDVYMPDCGLGGLLPVVNTDGISDNKLRTSGIEALLIELGVRQDTQDEPAEKICEWMVELEKRENNAQSDESFRWGESDRVAKQRGKYAKAAKAVYAHYLKKFGEIPKDSPVPYLRETDKGVFIAFALARDVFWLDQPYLDEPGIRKAVVKAGFKVFVFPLKVENADKSGLDPISKKLNMDCAWGDDSPEKARLLREKYAERRRILQLIIPENAKSKLSEDIEIFAHKKLWMESQEFPEIKPETDFHITEDGKLFVNSDGDDLRKWSALAAGLSTIADIRVYAPDLELLLIHGKDECERRLRNHYHLTEEALRESGFFAVNPSDSLQENAEEAEMPMPDSGSPTAVENIEAPARDTTMPHKENRISLGETGESPAASGQSSIYPHFSGERIYRLASPGGKSGGGDPEIKKEVEKAAVQAATRHYKSRGYEVESVETENFGWDLEAVKGGEKLRVEVKGISKGEVYVNMTPNEFRAAQQHRQSYRLAVFRKHLDVGCAIYELQDNDHELQDNDQWRWIDGNDKSAAKKLATEERISTIMVVKAID